jgi:hypothetical protein
MNAAVLYTGPDTDPLDVTTVSNTYSGRTGCACGCCGTYDTGGLAFTRRIAKVNRAIKSGTPVRVYVFERQHVYDLESADGERATRIYVQEASER